MRKLISLFFLIALSVIIVIALFSSFSLMNKVKSDDFVVNSMLLDTTPNPAFRISQSIIDLNSFDKNQIIEKIIIPRIMKDYFEIIPISLEMERRVSFEENISYQRAFSLFRFLPELVDRWKKEDANEYISLANQGVLREVEVCSIKMEPESNFDYYRKSVAKNYPANYYEVRLNLISYDKVEDSLYEPKIQPVVVRIAFGYLGVLDLSESGIKDFSVLDPLLFFDFGVFNFDYKYL